MPLQRQLVSVPFTGGLDTKTDPKLVIPGKMSRLENAVFKGSTIQKRNGTQFLSHQIDGGALFSSGESLFTFGNELAQINQGVAYGLSSVLGKWEAKQGGGMSATLTNTRIMRNSRTQSQFDQASVNGISVITWIEPYAGLQLIPHVMVLDEATGTIFQNSSFNTGTAFSYASPRCVVIGTTVLVFFVSNQSIANNLQAVAIDTTNPATVPTPVYLRNDAYPSFNGAFDAIPYAGGAAVVYSSNTTNNDSLTFIQVNASLVVSGSPAPRTYTVVTDTGSGAGVNGIGAISLIKDNGYLLALYSDDGVAGSPKSYMMAVDTSFNTFLAKTQILAASYVSAALYSTATNQVTAVLYSSGLGLPLQKLVVSSASGVVTAAAPIPGTYGLALVSDMALFNGVICYGVTNRGRGSASATVQPTAFVVDLSGNCLARALMGTCDFQAQSRLSRTVVASSGAALFLFSERGRLTYSSVVNQTTDVTPRGITRVAVTPVSSAILPNQRLGEVIYVGGAVPRCYDGQALLEIGLSLPPEGLTATSAGAGGLSAGAYQWRAVYSWLDGKGQLVRSPPSPAVTVVSAGSLQYTVTVPTLPLSARDLVALGAPVQVELYRTTANGTIFYRASSPNQPNYNVTNAATTAFTDTLPDANLLSGELLYTTGGVLDWLAPPAHRVSCVHKDRLFIAGLEDPQEYRFSSKVIRGEALRFNEVFSGRIPASAGPITALASLDDKLVVFTASTFFVVFGDGPDNLGNNAFSAPQAVASADTGCASPPALVAMPEGLMFQGTKGLCLLTRGLETVYIGADVEAYGQLNFRAATLLASVEQVRFLADSGSDATGVCLVYDYHYQQWSVFTNYGGQNACLYQGAYTRSVSNGAFVQEASGYTDVYGGTIAWVAETAWLKYAGNQGFQRIINAFLLGNINGSGAGLLWEVAFDYSGNGGAPTYDVRDAITVQGTNYTGGAPFQVRRKLRVQKCEAVKFRFTDGGTTGQGTTLTDLSLEVGVRQGGFRLPTSKSFE